MLVALSLSLDFVILIAIVVFGTHDILQKHIGLESRQYFA
jgi:hypothetical protein